MTERIAAAVQDIEAAANLDALFALCVPNKD